MFDANQRKYPRVNYPCQLTAWLLDGSHKVITTKTSNIGLGGLCIYLDHPLDVGIKVDVQLQFPGTTTPFKCRGTVVRSMPEPDGRYNTGVEFETLSELKHTFLESHIAEIIEAQKGKS